LRACERERRTLRYKELQDPDDDHYPDYGERYKRTTLQNATGNKAQRSVVTVHFK